MAQVHLTMKSRNAKTGPIPVSTSSAKTCPAACPFNNANAGGCYADAGPLAMHWRKVTSGVAGNAYETFCQKVEAMPAGQVWRHNQAGDLAGIGDRLSIKLLRRLVRANTGKRGFTYTHKPLNRADERDAIRDANRNGFTVNLSGNNLTHADELAALGIAPVVTVLPADQTENTTTPGGRRVVVCPATQRDDVTCASCKLCAVANRGVIVGFPAHGASKRKADAIARN